MANLGTPALRHWVGQNFPLPDLNHLVYLTDVIYETSKMIFNEKKAALEKGDDAVVLQIGEGRDIMSVLSEYSL